MELILLVLALVNLVAIAGIIYPFRPFRRRSRALLTFVASFLLVGIIGSQIDPDTRDQAGQEPVVTSGSTTGSRAETGSSDDPGAALAEGDTKGTSAEPSSQPKGEPSQDQLPPLAQDTRNEILSATERAEWGTATRLILAVRGKFDLAATVPEIEASALKVVRPLPASDFLGNEKGYRFLSRIVPENPLYREKAEDYARRGREAEERARRNAIAKLRTKEDKVEGITWFKHPNQPKYTNSRSTVYLYIGRREHGRPWLRMQIQYASKDWLFVDKVEAWHDGVKETLYSGRFERDHHSSIWEWVDVNPTDHHLSILDSIANSNEAILRFHGAQYRRDVTVSSADKRALREMFSAFEAMKKEY